MCLNKLCELVGGQSSKKDTIIVLIGHTSATLHQRCDEDKLRGEWGLEIGVKKVGDGGCSRCNLGNEVGDALRMSGLIWANVNCVNGRRASGRLSVDVGARDAGLFAKNVEVETCWVLEIEEDSMTGRSLKERFR
jgi:hypothetical protein